MVNSSPDSNPSVLSRYPTGEPVLNALPASGTESKKEAKNESKDQGQPPTADAGPKKKKKA